jgi:hypothetical protein
MPQTLLKQTLAIYRRGLVRLQGNRCSAQFKPKAFAATKRKLQANPTWTSRLHERQP